MRVQLRFAVTVWVLCTCSMLVACSRGPVAASHTVDWYLSHKADRTAMVERCANDPGTLGKNPDCVNAFAAAQRADIGSLRGLPPMGLGGERQKSNAAPGQTTPKD